MNDDATKQNQTDGKDETLAYVGGRHHGEVIYMDDLGVGGRLELPGGWSVTSNPAKLSILNPDPWRTVLFGPLGDQGIPLPLREGPSGPYVTGLDLAFCMMVLLRVGPPVWERNPRTMMQWIVGQISQCESFEVPPPAPRTREENEAHIAACSICRPVSEAMSRAIDAGANIGADKYIADMIDRAHQDQEAAIRHFEAKVAALNPLASPRATARKKEVAV